MHTAKFETILFDQINLTEFLKNETHFNSSKYFDGKYQINI